LHFSSRIVGDRTDAGKKFAVIFERGKGLLEMSKGQPPDRHDWLARATEALEKARKMKPGAERNEALKKAGQLQTAADVQGYLASKELQPPK
jgi:hypothetical protein